MLNSWLHFTTKLPNPMNRKSIYAAFSPLLLATVILSCDKPAATTEAAPPSTDHVNMMIKDWERAKKFTQAYLDSANDKTVTYKLSEKTPRTFGQQLLHLADANYGLGKAGTGKAYRLEKKNLRQPGRIYPVEQHRQEPFRAGTDFLH